MDARGTGPQLMLPSVEAIHLTAAGGGQRVRVCGALGVRPRLAELESRDPLVHWWFWPAGVGWGSPRVLRCVGVRLGAYLLCWEPAGGGQGWRPEV